VAEFLQHQPTDGLVFTLGGPKAGGLVDLVDAQQPRHLPAQRRLLHVGGGVVVLVADVADDLLDQVLDGDHAGRAAVLVDHQCRLQAVGPHLGHQGIAVEGGRDGGHRHRQYLEPGAGPHLGGYREHLLDVHDADGLVEVPVDHGEPGEAGLGGRGDQIGDGVVGLQHLDLGARSHEFLGDAGAELQRAVDQGSGGLVEGAAFGGVAHQRPEFLRGARRAQFLGRLDADAAQDPVRGAVGGLDQRCHRGREHQLESRGGSGRRQRPGNGQVLGDQLAEHHRQRRGDQDGQRQRDTRHDAGRDTEGVQHGVEQPGQHRLGQVTGGQRGDRDAELRAGKLEGQRAVGALDHRVAAGAGAGVGVDGAAFQRGQRELCSDEQGGADGQNDDRQQAQHGNEDVHCVLTDWSPGRSPGCLGEGSASASSGSCSTRAARSAGASTGACGTGSLSSVGLELSPMVVAPW
jgi:hypothetical protein